MTWDVEYTDELEEWWTTLTEAEQESIDASVRLLEEKGLSCDFLIHQASKAPNTNTCGS